MKTIISMFATAAFFLIFSVSVTAQDAPVAKKYDNPEWKRVVFVDYHSGMQGKATSIVKDYYMKASAKAGTPGPAMTLALETGQYDMMYVWNLVDGVESLNWDRSPNNIKWWAALVEIAGSEEKAKEIRAEYNACVRSAKSDLGRVAN